MAISKRHQEWRDYAKEHGSPAMKATVEALEEDTRKHDEQVRKAERGDEGDN